jgi:signal transduction histidine kinase/ActR/RegA family two-component response regulator
MSLSAAQERSPASDHTGTSVPAVRSGHHVVFFDESLYPCSLVADYLCASIRRGGAGVAIAADEHLAGIGAALAEDGIDVRSCTERGQLILLGAAETLAALQVDGELDETAFDGSIGERMRSLADRFGSVRAFGEIVDILSRRGLVGAAVKLEGLWSELCRAGPFDLLCAYDLETFEHASAQTHFARVCDGHLDVLMPGVEGASTDPARLLAHLEQRHRALRAEVARRELIEADRARLLDEERRTSARLRVLAAAGETLAQSLDPHETLRALARLAVPAFSDHCAVDLVDRGEVRRVAVHDTHPDRVRAFEAFARSCPTRVGDASPIVQVLATGSARLFARVTADHLRRAARNDEELALLQESRFLSAIVVPLVARGERIGVLSFATSESGRGFDERDLQLAEELGRRAGLAVSNARLYGAVQIAAQRAEVEARKAAEERLRALEANRIKDEFLATVSHELRTPLNAITGWSALLQHRIDDRAIVTKGLEVIRRNAQTQARLVEDILDVSRIVTGKLRIDQRPVDMAAIARESLEVLRPSVEAKQIAVTLETPSQDCLLMGDEPRLQQVVWNLLSNAIKFNSPGGQVSIRLRRDAEHVVLVVADTGRGIEPEFLPYVFDRFRQADSSTTRTFGGLGLGLAIVRHIVELHGGRASAESQGTGKGATFRVALPVRAVATLQAADEPAALDRPSSTAIDGAHLTGARILVIDDEREVRDLVEAILADAGAIVATAGTVGEALGAIERFRPEVIVSDVSMPDGDGYALIRRIRSHGAARGGHVPAVALTTHARSEDRIRALAAGYNTHVTKPVEPGELVAVVASLRGLRRATPATPLPRPRPGR